MKASVRQRLVLSVGVLLTAAAGATLAPADAHAGSNPSCASLQAKLAASIAKTTAAHNNYAESVYPRLKSAYSMALELGKQGRADAFQRALSSAENTDITRTQRTIDLSQSASDACDSNLVWTPPWWS